MIWTDLVDKIMEGFTGEAIKPAYDCNYVYAYVVQKIMDPSRTFLISPQPHCLKVEDHIWDEVYYAIQERVIQDPLLALGQSIAIKEATDIPKGVSSGGKTVYWPSEYFYHAVRKEVGRAVADVIESKARKNMGFKFPPSFIGVLEVARRYNWITLTRLGNITVSMERAAGSREWALKVTRDQEEIARTLLPYARLPFGNPSYRVRARVPADPFAASISGYIYHPKAELEKTHPIVVFEANIRMDGSVLIHTGVMYSQYSHLAVSGNRIGNYWIEISHWRGDDDPEIDLDLFERETSMRIVPTPVSVKKSYCNIYCVYTYRLRFGCNTNVTVLHSKGEHPSWSKQVREDIEVIIRPISYIQGGHD